MPVMTESSTKWRMEWMGRGGGERGGDTFHHSEFQRKNAPPLGLILQKIHNVAGEFLGGKHGATQQPGLKEGQLHGNTG